MRTAQLLFLLLVFAVVGGLVGLAMTIFSPRAIRERLDVFMGKADAGPREAGGGWVERVAKVVQPFSKPSLPGEGWETSTLRTAFMNAGWRSASAPTLYFAAKTVLALGLPAAGALGLALAGKSVPGESVMLLLFTTAASGYYLPNVVLARIAKRRRREVFETIPDALDLLTVCVEAGLSLERALSKVASEIHIKSVVLAQELQMVMMEMRTGFSREKALRNLALRTGVEDVDTLVGMLIQSERYGTSMGTSLRVHSDNLRTKRRLIAEEAAAKIALKLMFPLIFCIFPIILMVLMGPAVIQIVRSLMPALSQAQ